MKYYLAAEGGGSKLLTVLYNEHMEVLRMEQTRGTNSAFRPVELISADMEALLDRLLPADCTCIESLDMGLVGCGQLFDETVRRRVAVRCSRAHREGNVALAAAGVRYGIVAQAGTGSDAFLIQPDCNFFVGGWGPLLGDEGSGYHIGLAALKAAIYASDGRGQKTILYDMVMEAWKLDHLWDMIAKIINDPDARHLVASASRLAAKAAAMGDEVALGIYERAGHELSHQVVTAIGNRGGVWEGPIVLSGGAWKGSERMADTFRADIAARFPDAKVIKPLFEPVVGCVVLRCLSEGRDIPDIWDGICAGFSDLRLSDI